MRLWVPLLLIGLFGLQDKQEEEKREGPKDPGKTGVCKPDEVEKGVIREARNNSRVMAHLRHLTKKIGPRLTGSDNLTRACEWARSKFEEWGLKNVHLEEWGTFPVGFNRGKSTGRMIKPVKKDLAFVTDAWTAGTDGPVEGPVKKAPEEGADLSGFKGCWVIGRMRRSIRRKLQEAGALGTIRGSRDDLLRVSGNPHISWDHLPKQVSIMITKTAYDEIISLLDKGEEVRLEFDIRNEFKKGPIKLFNVIAEIPGTEKPEEVVIVGGHIDSWDAAEGATDNGTGVATTMEAARLLAKAGAKPKRTIRFMLWSGEEQGLLGSRAYVKKHKDEMKNISCVFVHDGGTNYIAGIYATKSQVPVFEKVFATVMKLDPQMPFEVKEVDRLSGGSSDHDSFIRMGVPAYFWRQKGRANYVYGWHTQNDRYELAIEEYQKHSSIVVAIGAWGVANLDELLPRDGLKPGGVPGGPRRRVLGIRPDEDGRTILRVYEDTPAERAGLKEDDVIVRIGGIEVKDHDSLKKAIREAPKKTRILILRNGKRLELDVEFDR